MDPCTEVIDRGLASSYTKQVVAQAAHTTKGLSGYSPDVNFMLATNLKDVHPHTLS